MSVKVFKGTWLGARATQKEVTGADSGLPRGQRLLLMLWHDDAIGQPVEWPAGTVVRTVTKGNFLKGTGVVIEAARPTTQAEFDSYTK